MNAIPPLKIKCKPNVKDIMIRATGPYRREKTGFMNIYEVKQQHLWYADKKFEHKNKGWRKMFYGNKLIIQYNKVIFERNVFMCRLKVSHFAYLERRKIL